MISSSSGTVTLGDQATIEADLTSTNTKLDTLHTDVATTLAGKVDSTNTKLDTAHTDLGHLTDSTQQSKLTDGITVADILAASTAITAAAKALAVQIHPMSPNVGAQYHVTTPNKTNLDLGPGELDRRGNAYIKSVIRHKRLLALTSGVAATYADLPSVCADFLITDTEGASVAIQCPEDPQVVQNGTFGAATGWTGFNADWVRANGKATHVAGNTTVLSQTLDGSWATGCAAVVPGRSYAVCFTVTDMTTSTLIAKLGTTAGATVSANGFYVQVIVAQSNVLSFTPGSTLDGAVSDVWVLPFTWALHANEITPISATKVVAVLPITSLVWVAQTRFSGNVNLG